MKHDFNSSILASLIRIFMILILFLSVCQPVNAKEASKEGIDETTLILGEIQDILDTTIITASRTGTTLGKSTRSVGLITKQDMEAAQNYAIPDMVDHVPGVFLRREGGPGQLKHILIRGVSDDYTQMQYNGIPLKDPSDLLGSLYYSYTNFYSGLNISNIEVLKGVNSTLYGSQAIGGVINIASEKWIDGHIYEDRTELGQHHTITKQNRIAYGNGDVYADVSLQLIDTDGDDNGGDEDFYYKNKGLFANFGKRFGNNISLEFHSLYYDADAPMTYWSQDERGAFQTTYASATDYRNYRFSQNALVFNHTLSPVWDYIIKAAYTKSRVDSHYDFGGGYASDTNEDGDTTYIEVQNNLYPTTWLTLVTGVDYERIGKTGLYASTGYEYAEEYNMETWDLFMLAKTAFFDESLFFDAGIRYSDPDEFDAETAWEFSAAYVIYSTGTKIFGHLGTGFRMPSLSEVSSLTEMKPEKALSLDAGIEQVFFNKKVKLGATWYSIRFEDVGANNLSENRSRGIEAFVKLKPCKYFGLDAAYTYTENENKYDDSEWEKDTYMYVPRNSVNVIASFYPVERLTARFSFAWMSEVNIKTWGSDEETGQWITWEWAEDDPIIVDLAVTYKLLDYLDIWLRFENLFDEDYSSMAYTMPGRWIHGGIKFTF